MTRIGFPSDFLWGTATSSYQSEGAWDRDGKGESIWDRFCHTPGRIKDGSTGDTACDHYQRFRDDVALMQRIGMNAYRFSIAWPRVLPAGKGPVNPAGLAFYSRLTDRLLEAGVRPLVTLSHWDLPLALQDLGGWANRDIAGWFGDYVSAVARRLGDRVDLWVTLNEPQIFGMLGYYLGEHAPGLTDPLQYLQASHNINLAHGTGVQALRAEAPSARVGTTLQLPPVYPRTDSDRDRTAARTLDGMLNRWYADPVFLGRYPEDILDLFGPVPLPIRDGDMKQIHQPLDFAGLNVYTRLFAYHEPAVPLFEAMPDPGHRVPGARYTAFDWEIYPPCIYESLMRFKNEWGDPPVYVTENGMASDDRVVDGRVEDPERIGYLADYLSQVRRAMDEGVKVRGYFLWSFLDNFEWAEGYTKRFGIVHVDFRTLDRTPKASAAWYGRVIREGGFRHEGAGG